MLVTWLQVGKHVYFECKIPQYTLQPPLLSRLKHRNKYETCFHESLYRSSWCPKDESLVILGLFILCKHEVDICDTERNVLTSITWIVMKFGTHIYVPLWMNSDNIPMLACSRYHLAHLVQSCRVFSCKCFQLGSTVSKL